MNKEIIKRINLGIFVLAGILMLIFALYVIGKNKNMFSSTITIHSTFNDVSGLQIGNNVRYSGIDIGTIDNIQIMNDTSIVVTMIIDESLQKYIRKNSTSTIGTDGLMGNKLVNIVPGTLESALIKDGDEIVSKKSIDTEKMMRTLESTNLNIEVVSSNLKSITDNITKSQGTLYTVLMDTTISKSLKTTIENIQITSKNLTTVTEKISSIVNDVKTGNGVVNALIYDSTITNNLHSVISEIKTSSEKFSIISKNISQLVTDVNNGKGTVGTLLNDSAAENNLKQTLINLRRSTEKIDQELEALKHSFLLRGFFKNQDKEKNK